MTNEEQKRVAEYAKKHYKRTFSKKTIERNGRGAITKVTHTDIEPIVSSNGIYYMVRTHVDASPIILSKTILVD